MVLTSHPTTPLTNTSSSTPQYMLSPDLTGGTPDEGFLQVSCMKDVHLGFRDGSIATMARRCVMRCDCMCVCVLVCVLCDEVCVLCDEVCVVCVCVMLCVWCLCVVCCVCVLYMCVMCVCVCIKR